MDLLESEKPHAVCVPFPAQGHINGMLKLAKVLHYKGFHITFVNTEHNHRRILHSRGPGSLNGLPGFRFETIPDGLPPAEDVNATQDMEALSMSTRNYFSIPLRELVVAKLNNPSSSVPPVTCIISDHIASFTLKISDELNIPNVFFCSMSACGYMCILHYEELVQRGIVPFKDVSDLINRIDTPVDWIPGMKNMRLRELTSSMLITKPNNVLFNFLKDEVKANSKATAIVINTFNDLESPVLDAMTSILPPIYTLGPLSLLSRQLVNESPLGSVGLNLWKEDSSCLEWLDGRQAGSVVYVNFGSLTIMTNQQLIEFAWGLASSGYDFLWVIRPDVVAGDAAVLPPEFLSETSGTSMLASWCPQEKVLQHPAVGGFLTHCGWNSIMESVSCGVPMICRPVFADQQTNCRYMCTEWGIGMEIDKEMRKEEVSSMIKELMGGEKGKEMRKRALEWKESAIRATQFGGSTFENLDRLIKEVILP